MPIRVREERRFGFAFLPDVLWLDLAFVDFWPGFRWVAFFWVAFFLCFVLTCFGLRTFFFFRAMSVSFQSPDCPRQLLCLESTMLSFCRKSETRLFWRRSELNSKSEWPRGNQKTSCSLILAKSGRIQSNPGNPQKSTTTPCYYGGSVFCELAS